MSDSPINHKFIHATNREQLRRIGVEVINETSITDDGVYTIDDGDTVTIDVAIGPDATCKGKPVELAYLHFGLTTAGIKVKYEKGVPNALREISAYSEDGFFPVFNGVSDKERTVRFQVKNDTGGEITLPVAPIVWAHMHR